MPFVHVNAGRPASNPSISRENLPRQGVTGTPSLKTDRGGLQGQRKEASKSAPSNATQNTQRSRPSSGTDANSAHTTETQSEFSTDAEDENDECMQRILELVIANNAALSVLSRRFDRLHSRLSQIESDVGRSHASSHFACDYRHGMSQDPESPDYYLSPLQSSRGG